MIHTTAFHHKTRSYSLSTERTWNFSPQDNLGHGIWNFFTYSGLTEASPSPQIQPTRLCGFAFVSWFSINSSVSYELIFWMQIQEINGAESEMTRNGNVLSNSFLYIFYIHLLLITVLVFFLVLRGVLSTVHTHHFHPKKWYVPVLLSTACGGIVGFAWQAFTSINPSRAVKTTFWLSPLLTCAFGILLVLIGTPGSLAASVIAIVSSLFQSLYACWVTPRFDRTFNYQIY